MKKFYSIVPILVVILVLATCVHVRAGTIVLEAPYPTEITSERTVNSKTTYIGPGKYALDVSVGKVHYQDNGQWKNINNEFVAANAPWDWVMDKAGYTVQVKEDFTAGQILQFEKQGETVTFQPMALAWVNDEGMSDQISMPQAVTPLVSSPATNLIADTENKLGTITWENGYGTGIDFRWQCTPTRLQKRLIIDENALPMPNPDLIDFGNEVFLRLSLIFDPSKDLDIYVDNAVWNQKDKAQTFKAIEFRKDGETLFGFMPLRYWDSDFEGGQSVATLEKRGGSLYISVQVPFTWLMAPRTYPVYVDTDVDEQVGASEADAHEYDNDTGFDSTSNTVDMDGRFFDYQRRNAGFWYENVAIPAGATIGANSYLNIYVYSTTYDDACVTIYGNDVDSANDFSAEADVTSRDVTTASVSWNQDGLGIGWHASPGADTEIQEVIDRGGWASGNNLCMIVKGCTSTKSFRTLAYDYDTALCAKLHVEYTGGAATPDISNSPSTFGFGVVDENSSYWTFNLTSGYSPTFPLNATQCYFNITNNTADAVDVAINATNFTGGVGWTINATAAGDNIVVLKSGKAGDANEAAMVTINGTAQAFVTNLASGASIQWELKLETSTFTDGVLKEAIITLTATLNG